MTFWFGNYPLSFRKRKWQRKIKVYKKWLIVESRERVHSCLFLLHIEPLALLTNYILFICYDFLTL
jgi:hypothetical protein